MLLPSKSYAFCNILNISLLRVYYMTAWLGLEKKNNFLACPLPLFTKKLVVWLFCCLVVLLIARSPQLRQRDFSLFTLHFSLFT